MLVLRGTFSFNPKKIVKIQKRQNCNADWYEYYFNYCIITINKKNPSCGTHKDHVKHHWVIQYTH